jgi:hypothetical protein
MRSVSYLRNVFAWEIEIVGSIPTYFNLFDKLLLDHFKSPEVDIEEVYISKAHRLVGNKELTEKYERWLSTFPWKTLRDKREIFEELSGVFLGIIPTYIMFINQEYLITLVIRSGKGNDDFIVFVNLLLASGSCSKMAFDIEWLKYEQPQVNDHCMQWIKYALTISKNYFELSGLEFAVQGAPVIPTKKVLRDHLHWLILK